MGKLYKEIAFASFIVLLIYTLVGCALPSSHTSQTKDQEVPENGIIITAPDTNDTTLPSSSAVAFHGLAGEKVKKIRVTTACRPYIWRDAFGTVLTRPITLSGNTWTWSYDLPKGIDGVCRGENFVDFNPSTCETTSYSDACDLRKDFVFTSFEGYLGSNEIVLLQLPSSTLEDEKLRVSDVVKINGSAGSEVSKITVEHSCVDLNVNRIENILKSQNELRPDGSWDWSYTLDKTSQTLCRGGNVLMFIPFPSIESSRSIQQSFSFFSEVGYVTPEVAKKINKINSYTTNMINEVESDPTVLIKLTNKVLSDSEICLGNNDTANSGENKSLPKLLVSPIQLDPNFAVQLRLADPNLDQNTNGLYIDEFTPIIEFLSQSNRTSKIVTPKPLPGWPCPYTSKNGADVYYLGPNRIIVDFGQGHESGNAIYVWNGKEWVNLMTLVPVDNPIELGPVNKEMFIIRETRACCDTFHPNIPGKWSDFIFDVKNLQIVDVHFRESS